MTSRRDTDFIIIVFFLALFEINEAFLSQKMTPLSLTHSYSCCHRLLFVTSSHSNSKDMELALDEAPNTVDGSKNKNESKAMGSFTYDPGFDYENSDLPTIFQKLDLRNSYKNHLASGLSMSQVSERLRICGPNALLSKPKKTWIQLFLDQFDDTLVRILLLIAMISLLSSSVYQIHSLSLSNQESLKWETVFHNLLEPLVILLILILNASVGVWQTIRATKSLEALEKMQPRLATVLRANQHLTEDWDTELHDSHWIVGIEASSLVPGDVIRIKAGDQVPADARICTILSSSISVDESSLTGESLPVYKCSEEEKEDLSSTNQKMAFSGSMVTTGSAIAIVVKTGANTEIGKIHESVSSLSDEVNKTPLGEKLDELGQKLSKIIGIICLLVWVISIPHFSDPMFHSTMEASIYYAKIAVALGVAAIPEGLPAIVSLTLSLGTRRMAEHNVIVRTLSSVETLGCTTVICSDKTGTLTLNQQTVVSLMLFHEDLRSLGDLIEHHVSGTSYNPQGDVENIPRTETFRHPDGAVSDLCQVMVLCNDARLVPYIDGNETRYDYEGEPTEAALLVLAEKLGPQCDSSAPPNIRVEYNRKYWSKLWIRFRTLEFDRERKSMSVICRSMVDDGIRIFVKGAPDTMLPRCSFIKSTDGAVIRISKPMRTKLEDKIAQMSSRPLRCLLMAFKNFTTDDISSVMNKTSTYMDLESNLVLVGVTGLIDPPRPDVSSSLSECKDAGIRVVMITGDNKDTASAVARDIGMFDVNQTDRVFDAADFFSMDLRRQGSILKTGNLVFSRTKPTQKQTLVEILQSNGEIVAMTGDGVNDAPALKKASIGVAMGSGTDVAKETADMVLLDDSFSSIVRAVAEGRSIYTNMKAFVNFLLSCNLGEVFAVVLATVLGLPSMLTATQLLWVNLVTDGLPAVALGFNPPDKGLMKKSPRSSEEEFIDNLVVLRYLISGAYIALATTGIFIFYFVSHGLLPLNHILDLSDCMEQAVGPTLCNDVLSLSELKTAQTIALSTLVCTELLKALCSVSTASLFKISPLENAYLIASVLGSLGIHLMLMYSDAIGLSILGESLGLVPITMNDWIAILAFSFPILVLEEILKFVFR